MQLDGKAVLITGSAKRVGRAIALELARGGCDVAIHFHRSGSEVKSLAEELAAIGRRAALVNGDLNDPTCWSRIVQESHDQLGRLDVLINNASLFLTNKPDTIDDFDLVQWDQMLRVNLTAPAGLSHFAAPLLAAHGDGCIVNLCDISVDRPWPAHLSYAVSKGGLVTLTRALARALAPAVRVLGVAPGIAVFPEEYDQELRAKLVRRVPLRREGTPDEVARLVRFLIESGDYITGQIVAIDGGRSVV
jgi:pteridine reductase